MHKFSNDDEGYLGWLAANPDGFVVNVRQVAGPNYAVLHRVTCRTIATGRSDGAYTERGYRKVVATELDALRVYVRTIGRRDGSFSSICGHCNPVGA